MKLAAIKVTSTFILLGICGCGCESGFYNLVGAPELGPPLGKALPIVAPASLPATARDGLNGGGSPIAVSAASGATNADLAGVWMHAGGFGAIHIDQTGNIYQIDLPDVLNGEPVPDFVPRNMFNVGRANVATNGLVTANLSISLAGSVFASASLRGTLDSTHNLIFAVTSQSTFDIGSGPQTDTDSSPWFRWDPITGKFPAVD